MSPVGTEHGLFRTGPSEETLEWLARVEKIAPVIEAHRQEAEDARATPRPVIEALRDAGIPRMWVSEDFGGERVSIETGSEVIQALARLDASVAWQMGVQGAIGRLSDYLPEPAAAAMFRGRGLVVGGVNPSGRAEEDGGGYVLEGEWAFASGSAHADWLVCAALVTRGGEVVRAARGPEVRMLFVPASEARMLDTWYTVGLRGTGSCHYRVDRVRVPEEFTVRVADMHRPPPARASRAYGISYYDFGPFTSASTALGIAQDALASFKLLAAGKTPASGSTTLAGSHTVQAELARAEMRAHSARVLLMDAARHVTGSGATGGEPLTALVRLTAAAVAGHATAAVDAVYELAGASSLYAASRLERCFRDVHSAVKHITLSHTHYEMVGQYLLGGDLLVRR